MNLPSGGGADSAEPYEEGAWEKDYYAGGGYLSSSGILAPYHKKLLDGLYAGGRISY